MIKSERSDLASITNKIEKQKAYESRRGLDTNILAIVPIKFTLDSARNTATPTEFEIIYDIVG